MESATSAKTLISGLIQDGEELDWRLTNLAHITRNTNVLESIRQSPMAKTDKHPEKLLFYKMIALKKDVKMLMLIPTMMVDGSALLSIKASGDVDLDQSMDGSSTLEDSSQQTPKAHEIPKGDGTSKRNDIAASLEQFSVVCTKFTQDFVEFGKTARNMFRYLGLDSELVHVSENKYFHDGAKIIVEVKPVLVTRKRPFWKLNKTLRAIINSHFAKFSNLLTCQIPYSLKNNTYYMAHSDFFDFLHYIEHRCEIFQDYKDKFENCVSRPDFSFLNSMMGVVLFLLGLISMIVIFQVPNSSMNWLIGLNVPSLLAASILYGAVFLKKKRTYKEATARAKLYFYQRSELIPQFAFGEFVPFFNLLSDPTHRAQVLSEHLVYWALNIESQKEDPTVSDVKKIIKTTKVPKIIKFTKFNHQESLDNRADRRIRKKIIRKNHENSKGSRPIKRALDEATLIDGSETDHDSNYLHIVQSNAVDKLASGVLTYEILQGFQVTEIAEISHRFYESGKLKKCSQLMYVAAMISFIEASRSRKLLPIDFQATHGKLSEMLIEMKSTGLISMDGRFINRIADWEDELIEERQISRTTIGSRFLITKEIMDFNRYNRTQTKSHGVDSPSFEELSDTEEYASKDTELSTPDQNVDGLKKKFVFSRYDDIDEQPIPTALQGIYADVEIEHLEIQPAREYEDHDVFEPNSENLTDPTRHNISNRHRRSEYAASISFNQLEKGVGNDVIAKYEKEGFLYKNEKFLNDFLDGRI